MFFLKIIKKHVIYEKKHNIVPTYCIYKFSTNMYFIDFSTCFSPRAAGRRRQTLLLRWLPVGCPPLGEFFFTKVIDQSRLLMILIWKPLLFTCDTMKTVSVQGPIDVIGLSNVLIWIYKSDIPSPHQGATGPFTHLKGKIRNTILAVSSTVP